MNFFGEIWCLLYTFSDGLPTSVIVSIDLKTAKKLFFILAVVILVVVVAVCLFSSLLCLTLLVETESQIIPEGVHYSAHLLEREEDVRTLKVGICIFSRDVILRNASSYVYLVYL